MNERLQVTIRLPAELKTQIEKEADRLSISFNEMIKLLYEKMETIHQKKK